MRANIFIEVELAGEGNGWTTLEDVIMPVPVQWKYGIFGHGIHDRVAGSGTLAFALDNSGSNSQGALGLYTPGHANVLAGWGMGIGIRLRVEYSDLAPYFKWRGVIDSIKPMPGTQRDRRVFVTAVDFMDDLARASVRGLPVQLNQRSDQLFETIIDAMPRQPPATEVGYGMEQYPYALDGSRQEGLSVMSEMQKLANSEVGFVYVKGDGTQGGTLTFEDRRRRGVVTDPVASFTSFNELSAARKRDDVINRVLVRVHPRRVDLAGDATTPDEIAGLTLWLRADDLVDALGDGGRVTEWQDQSGNGNDFVQPSGTDRPTLRTGIFNGHAAVEFDGSDDVLTGGAISTLITASDGTIFMVLKLLSFPGGVRTALGVLQATQRVRMAFTTSGTVFSALNNDGTNDATTIAGLTLGDDLITMWQHGGGTLYASVNDTRDASRSSTASGDTSNVGGTMLIGADGDGNSLGAWLHCQIAEVITYNVSLSEADRKDVESYLSEKYDIAVPYTLTGIGAIGTVVFTLEHVPAIVQGSSLEFTALYKDNAQKKARVGSTAQADPEATTDYLFNTAEDGSGTDITSQLTVVADFSGNSAVVTVTNNGPLDGFLTFFQLRGLGVYDEAEVIYEAEDTALQAEYGENVRTFDMPYQSDPDVARNTAFYLLALNKSELTVPDRVGFIASGSDSFMRQAILREISDRIHITDPLTAIDGDFFINGIEMSVTPEGVLNCAWTIVPADTDLYWILDSPTQSQLGETTKLAYGQFNRFWILGIAAMGTDTRLN